jgi:hypothetical protein
LGVKRPRFDALTQLDSDNEDLDSEFGPLYRLVAVLNMKQLVTQIPSPELSIANLEQQLISKGVRLDEKSQVVDISGKCGRHKTRGSSLECLENGDMRHRAVPQHSNQLPLVL